MQLVKRATEGLSRLLFELGLLGVTELKDRHSNGEIDGSLTWFNPVILIPLLRWLRQTLRWQEGRQVRGGEELWLAREERFQ